MRTHFKFGGPKQPQNAKLLLLGPLDKFKQGFPDTLEVYRFLNQAIDAIDDEEVCFVWDLGEGRVLEICAQREGKIKPHPVQQVVDRFDGAVEAHIHRKDFRDKESLPQQCPGASQLVEPLKEQAGFAASAGTRKQIERTEGEEGIHKVFPTGVARIFHWIGFWIESLKRHR